jgi:hypothetical protein
VIKTTLTGRQRYRVRKSVFGGESLVLQVEIRESGFHVDHTGCGQDVGITYWRDARVTDISTQEKTAC